MKWKRLKEFMYDRYHKRGVILHEKYKIEDHLGTGGYGIIYLCRDIQTNKSYVLKQLRPSKAKKLKEKQRFQYEVKLLKSINHIQIPQLFDYFLIDGQAYYVMQFIKGKNLEEVLFEEKQTYTELDALVLMEKLLNILDYLHDKQIFHSDIRPPNLIVNNDNVYLIDFGLAKQLSPENKEAIRMKKQDDFFDLGDCLLFILYSQFKGKKSKTKSWLEELTLNRNTVLLLKRLLGISEEYPDTSSIRIDLQKAINSICNENPLHIDRK